MDASEAFATERNVLTVCDSRLDNSVTLRGLRGENTGLAFVSGKTEMRWY